MAEVMTATPTMGPGNTIQWTLCDDNMLCGTGTKQDPFPIVDVKPNSGAQKVRFIIDDSGAPGIMFADDSLWVVQGKGQHPNQSGIDSGNQFSSADVTTNKAKTILTIADKNDNTGTLWLSYRLNFVDAAGKAVTPIDPDWKNGGGGGGMGSSNALAIATLIIGLATLATILFVAYQNSSLRRTIAGGRSGPADSIRS